MELLSSFAMGLAVNIVHDFIKSKIESGLKKDIDSAFEKSIKQWSPNKTIRNSKKTYLKKQLEIHFQSGNEYYDSVNDEVKDFLSIFNETLCSHPIAYRYFDDIKTENHYFEFKNSFNRIEDKIKSLQQSNEAVLHELKNHTSVLREWESQLEAYNNLLDYLKPKTALQLIDALEKRIKENNLDSNSHIQARIHFLKGTCLEMIKGEVDNSYIEFIRAYEMNSVIFAYKEKACFCYYLIGEHSKSSELVKNILNFNSLNVVANATKLLLNLSDFDSEINYVSPIVKKDFDFRRILYVSINKNENKENLITLFPEMVLYGHPLELYELCFQNLKRNSYIVDLAINRFFREFRIEFEAIRYQVDKLEILKITKNILESFANHVKDKELGGYTEVFFLNVYLDFLIEPKEDFLPILSSYYHDIPSPKNQLFGLLLANCYQQKERNSDAIEILEKIDPISQNAFNLILYCAIKIENKEKIFDTVNQKISLYENIGINEFEDILRCLRILNNSKILSRLKHDAIEKKIDSSFGISKFFNLYYKTLLNPSIKESPDAIDSIKSELVQNHKWILSFVTEIYLITENFQECITSFESQPLEYRTSYDISFYIFALYKDGTQNRKLIDWLKYWRVNIGYDSIFIRIELEKRAKIYDWKECLDICSFGLENELHEDFLYHYAISAFHLNDKNSFNKIVSQSINYQYEKQQRALHLINMLFHFEYYDDGIELCYRLAKVKENKESRTLFFSAFIKTSEKYFLDYEIVEIGRYVRYKLNDDEEIHTKFITDDSLSQSLLGLKVGDKIDLNRQFGTQKDKLSVQRICNKYLSLKLEIMDETKNPHSGLGLQSINLNDFDSPLDAILSIIPKQDEYNDTYEEYYSEKIKFSQLSYFVSELNQNIIATYYKLVYEKRGILKVDPQIFPIFSNTEEYSYILDFSSLIHLYELTKSEKIKLRVKFKISSFMMVLIKSYEADYLGYRNYDDYNLDAKFYSELKIWISEYCIIINPVSLLDMNEKNGNYNNPLFLYLINQVAMINEFSDSVLITDDLTYYQIYPLDQSKLMSTDIFLLHHLLKSKFV